MTDREALLALTAPEPEPYYLLADKPEATGGLCRAADDPALRETRADWQAWQTARLAAFAHVERIRESMAREAGDLSRMSYDDLGKLETAIAHEIARRDAAVE